MSDDLSALPPLPHSDGWRERLTAYAETLDLTPARLVMGVVVGAVVLIAGWRLMASSDAPPESRLPLVTTSAPAGGSGPVTTTTALAEVVVHVAGAVTSPGVQRLDAGARVVDAIDAAGGATTDADLGRVNLAAVLEDGQQVFVPKVGDVGGGAAGGAAPGDASPASSGDSGPVHLNTASETELEALPGIGPSLAEAIVDYRTTHGPFSSVDELLDVRGIGQSKLEALRDQVVL